MKKLFVAAVLVLPLMAMPARADGWILPFHGNASLNFQWNIGCGGTYGGGYQLGPWYHYWPLEAHFVTPAPTGYPYWPQPQGLAPPPANPVLPPPQSGPDGKPNPGPEIIKPIGYSYVPYQTYQPSIRTGAAPSYWYSNP